MLLLIALCVCVRVCVHAYMHVCVCSGSETMKTSLHSSSTEQDDGGDDVPIATSSELIPQPQDFPHDSDPTGVCAETEAKCTLLEAEIEEACQREDYDRAGITVHNITQYSILHIVVSYYACSVLKENCLKLTEINRLEFGVLYENEILFYLVFSFCCCPWRSEVRPHT